jgi:hypothetical protein
MRTRENIEARTKKEIKTPGELNTYIITIDSTDT